MDVSLEKIFERESLRLVYTAIERGEIKNAIDTTRLVSEGKCDKIYSDCWVNFNFI